MAEQTPKEAREFYIPRLSRERGICGTEFEVRLRNELTQRAIAKECADWLRRKATFRSNVTDERMMGFMNVDDAAGPDAPSGVIFILRNVSDSVNAGDRNRIHPFYMVYVDEAGAVVRNHLDPKKLLDTVRLLCRGKAEPCVELCRRFNAETDDGRQMEAVSALLGKAVESIVAVKAESDIDSLFTAGGTSALLGEVSGLADFELICFLVVKEAGRCA